MPRYFNPLDPFDLASESSIARAQKLERDQRTIARTKARIDTLERMEIRLGQEFSGPVSSKYLHPQDRVQEIAGFRKRLQDEVEELINANVRKQAEPEKVRRNISKAARILNELGAQSVKSRMRRPYEPNRFTEVSNRFDASPRTVFGTEANFGKLYWKLYSPYSSWKFSTRNFFKTGHLVVPCIQRAVRREVLHAKKKAHGHRVKHRAGRFSDIWC